MPAATLRGTVNVLRLSQLVSVVVYGGLLLAAVRFRLRQRERAAEWLVVTFALLEAIVVLGALLPPLGPIGPDLTRGSWERLGIDAVIAALMAFPYLLFRFARSFRERRSFLDRAVDLGLVAVLVWTILLPSLPLAGEPEPAWFTAYRWFVMTWWAGLLLSVSVSLWWAGRGQPGVVRRRMRWMAGAALILNATLVGSSMAGHDEAGRPTVVAALVTAVLGWLSAASFWMGFTPPAMLRRLWRAEEEAKLRLAEQGLVRATDRREAARVILAP